MRPVEGATKEAEGYSADINDSETDGSNKESTESSFD
jgi:hypothetical protein